MLLVTFHGDTGGESNVLGYPTAPSTNPGVPMLDQPPAEAELRDLAFDTATQTLYVVNGAKSASTITAYSAPTAGATTFKTLGTFLDATATRALSHPYALVFDPANKCCYVSNQDSNVVILATPQGPGKPATVAPGIANPTLANLSVYGAPPPPALLDGTFCASAYGALPEVRKPAPTSIPSDCGGLSASLVTDTKGKLKCQNSVRDLAVAASTLYVCDEPNRFLRLYSLPAGAYIGSGPTLPKSPTHLTANSKFLFVSAGDHLYWTPLTADPLQFTFQPLLSKTDLNKGEKFGGIAFHSTKPVVYVLVQNGTGTTGTGEIRAYDYAEKANIPVFSNETKLVEGLPDTPEFILHVKLGKKEN